jgi:diguanylate cyclase (GGDEF)-like protein
VVTFVLVVGIANLLVGYALALALAEPPFGGLLDVHRWLDLAGRLRKGLRFMPAEAQPEEIPIPEETADQVAPNAPPTDSEPPLPLVASVDELPTAWRELLEADQISPCWFADGIVHVLRSQLSRYREQVLTAEARGRHALASESAEEVEQLVADFRFLHHEWLRQLVEGAELLSSRRGRLGDAAVACQRLERTLFDQAARMESIDQQIAEIQLKTDLVVGCRRLLTELADLTDAVHVLRDDLTAALADVLRAEGILGELPRQHHFDSLTGRLNRLGLECLLGEGEAGRRGARHVILMGLDRFRRINERWGARAGDRILKALGQWLVKEAGGGETATEVARLSGQEFAIVLGDCTRDEAAGLAERLRQSLEAATFEDQGTSLELSATLAVSAAEPGEAWGAVLARLYAGLDAARQAGRNRCAICEGSTLVVVIPHALAVQAQRVSVEGGNPALETAL